LEAAFWRPLFAENFANKLQIAFKQFACISREAARRIGRFVSSGQIERSLVRGSRLSKRLNLSQCGN